MANGQDTSSRPRPAPQPEPVKRPPPIQHQTVQHPLPDHAGKDK